MLEDQFKALTSPLGPDEVTWKIQSFTKTGNTIVVPYIDNRAVLDRFDECFGQVGWKNELKSLDGGFVCGISVKVGEEWITKYDGASLTSIEPVKGGISDSMKRAGNQWGLGRDLYSYPRVFVEGKLPYLDYKIVNKLKALVEAKIDGKLTKSVYTINPSSL